MSSPTEVESHVETGADNGQPATESPEKENAEKPKTPDETFLDALRGFVRRANEQPEEKKQPQKIGKLQAAVLLVLVVDIVLTYTEFQRWFENPVFQFALKVAPWLLGATAFTYSDQVRTWVLEQCKRMWLGILAVLLLFPLVILRQPLFSVRVRVASESVSVSSDDSRIVTVLQEGGVFLVTLPDLLKPYKISIKDEHNVSSTPITMTLGRLRVMRATFAQIPLLGRLFGAPELGLPKQGLSPLYRVPLVSKGANGYADIEGEFQEGFFQGDILASIGCSKLISLRSGIRCDFRGDGMLGGLPLPVGEYRITVVRDTCRRVLLKRKVSQDVNEQIDVDSICSH